MTAGRRPNLFLIGGPKCGTSSLWTYLSSHPRVFLSTPKEPAYWAFDYPGARSKHSVRIESLEDYLALFAAAGPQHLLTGEASTAYLSSAVAVQRILDFNPASRFLVMVRNPIEVTVAWHRDRRWSFDEDLELEDAWAAQPERAAGRGIPATCLVPEYLQYRRMASFGAQLQRLYERVPRERVRVLIFDDFARDPGGVYRETLRFLELDDDGRQEFAVVNQAKRHRFALVARLLLRPPGRLRGPVRGARRLLSRFGVAKRAKEWLLRRPAERAALDPRFRELLEAEFRPDVRLLSELLERDLSGWLSPQPRP